MEWWCRLISTTSSQMHICRKMTKETYGPINGMPRAQRSRLIRGKFLRLHIALNFGDLGACQDMGENRNRSWQSHKPTFCVYTSKLSL